MPKRPERLINCANPTCEKVFNAPARSSKYCSRFCTMQVRALAVTPDERFRRGLTDPDISRARRYRQLATEEATAERLRQEGWEIFSPTAVCDRVGVKDGKVVFLEFKPKADQRLRSGQRRIADLMPENYQVVVQEVVPDSGIEPN